MSVRLRDIWAEADPLWIWGYDYPGREMMRWEMPTYRLLSALRKPVMRAHIWWLLLTTGPNTTDIAPWDQRGWRRAKVTLAILLPIPARWTYPSYRENVDSVLIWWASELGSTPNGYTWRARYVGVGYGWSWRVHIWEDGE